MTIFNRGVRGARTTDGKNIGGIGNQFIENKYPQPSITGYTISGSDDTALNPAGGQTVLVNGTGFATGVSATLAGTQIASVTLVSPTQISFTSPAKAGGSYSLVVYNSTGGAAILVPGLTYSSVPTYTTAAGSIGSYYETTAINTQVVATSDSAITYSLASGSLPSGATLYGNGVITGTSPVDSSSTTYTFDITATDAELQDVTRTFTLTINTDVVSWVTPSSGATISLDGTAYSQALSATDAAGYSVSYTANALPTGLTLSTGTISGTPTTEGTTTTLLTATAATTNRTGTNTITWVVSLSDSYWKYVSLLLNGSTPTTTFINDASLNNSQLTIAGDTRQNNFNPYVQGYYSNYLDGTGDYLTVPNSSSSFAFGTGDFTIEYWMYARLVSGTTNGNIVGYSAAGAGHWNVMMYLGNLYWQTGQGVSNLFNVAIDSYSNRWTHYAFVRSSGTTKLYINGVQQASSADSTNYTVPTATLMYIGYNSELGYLNGYISNLRIVKGTAVYTTAFTPSTTPLTAVANTTLLTCQSPRLIDNSNNNLTITKNGDTSVSSSHPFTTPTTVAYNTLYSTYFDGTGDYLTIADNANFEIGLNVDFTIEAWFNIVSLPSSGNFADIFTKGASGVYQPYYLFINPSGSLLYYSSSTGSSWDIASAVSFGTISVNTWYHVAISRQGTNTRLFLNGALINTIASSGAALYDNTRAVAIGGRSDGTETQLVGTISNVRFVKGTAVYTSAFTPPTTSLTAVTNTVLLTCQDATIKDNSTNAFTITSNGDVKPVAVSPFTMTTSNTTVTSLGSAYFDGTGDYLQVPYSTSYGTLPADFTIEIWFYPTIANMSAGTLFSPRSFSAYQYVPYLVWLVNTTVTVYMSSDSGSWNLINGGNGGTAIINAWNHFALVRSGSAIKTYLNGVAQSASATSSATLTNPAIPLNLGATMNESSNFTGYLSDFRLVKGTALYTSNFLPPQTPLTPVTNTQILTLQYNGGANNNGFVDQSSFNNIVVKSANATVGTFSPYSQTGWSNYFDGSGDYLSLASNSAYAFGTDDFTIEAWINYTGTLSGNLVPIAQNDAIGSSTNDKWFFAFNNATLFFNTHSSGGFNCTIPFSLSVGVWYHVAVTRTSGTVRMFLNGQSTTVTVTGTPSGYSLSQNGVTIGGMSTPYYMTGYISNFRMVTGTSLYSATFTVSTTPLAPVAKTSVLSCQSNRLIDNSSYNATITRNGDTTVQAYSPFGGVTSVPTSYSNYFDGSGDYLRLPIATSGQLGSGNFTVECWVYLISKATSYPTIFCNYTTYTAGAFAICYAHSSGNTSKYSVIVDGNFPAIYSTGSITYKQWTHLAVARSGSTVTFYIDGVVQGTYSSSATLNGNGSYTYIGSVGDDLTNGCIQGYVSNLRVVVGTALYTSAFTPSTNPLTTTSQSATASEVKLLTCQSNTIVDNSPNYYTVTAFGNTNPYQFNPFGLTNTTNVSYSPSVNGGSMYFDGTGDKLTIANYPTLAFGSNAFTIQGWFYTNVSGTEQVIMTNGWASYAPWLIRINTSNQVLLNMSFNGGSWYVNEAQFGTATIKQWNHVAVTRSSSGTLRAFYNGVQGYTTELGTSALYNGSQALNVGGRSDTSVPFNGYLSDCQLINGVSLYSANFAPPATPATPTGTVGTTRYDSTLLLTGASGGIIDYHGSNDLETVGNTQLASEDPYGGSYYSNYFDGSGDNLTTSHNAAFNIDGVNATIEAWVYPISSDASVRSIFCHADATGPWTGYQLAIQSQKIVVETNSNGTTGLRLAGNTTLTLGKWYHVTLVKSSTTFNIYVDGVLDATGTSSLTTDVSIELRIGSDRQSTPNYLTAFISNLRMIKGQSLYTGNFTPSISPLTTTSVGTTGANVASSITGTVSILTCQSNKFVDNSTNAFTITSNGDTKVKSMNPFQQNTGKSLYFDGTGDYLYSTYVEPIRFGSGNFTIEFWMYPTVLGAAMVILSSAATGIQGGNVDIRTDYIGATSTPISFTGGGADAWTTYNGALINRWTYVAFVRNGNTVTLYINGTSIGTMAATTQGTTAFQAINIGGGSGLPVAGYQGFQGYMKDLRITKGYARYTTTFTPPTSPVKTK